MKLYLEIIGFAASVCDCLGFVPQAFVCYNTFSAKDISIWFLFLKLVALALWTVFGYKLYLRPIILKCAVNILCIIVILYVKIRTEYIPKKKLNYSSLEN